MFGPDVARVVGGGGTGVGVGDIAARDPGVCHIARLEGVEHQVAGCNCRVDAEYPLLARIVDLEDDVTVVEGDAERDAPRLDHISDDGDPAEVLRPHVDVNLEGRHAATGSPHIIGTQVSLRDLFVGDEPVLGGVVHQDLGVVHPAAEGRAEAQVAGEQLLVAAELVVPAAGENWQVVLLAGGTVGVGLANRRRFVEIVVDPCLLDHAELGVEVKRWIATRVHHTAFGNSEQQGIGHFDFLPEAWFGRTLKAFTAGRRRAMAEAG